MISPEYISSINLLSHNVKHLVQQSIIYLIDNFNPTFLIYFGLLINILAHIFFIGLKNPDYILSIFTNSFLIVGMVFITHLVKYMEKVDNENYSWMNYIIDIPIIYIILNNIYEVKNKYNNHPDLQDLDPTTQSYISKSEEDEDEDEDEEEDEEDEDDEEDEENEENEEDEEDEEVEEDEKPDNMSELEYEKMNEVLVEKYNQFMNKINIQYENRLTYLRENLRLTDEEVTQIEKVCEKLTKRQFRLVLRTINTIYQEKLDNKLI
jgi:hypothetical protein